MKNRKVAEILGVGTELLLGQIANTDAQYLSQRMSELGISVYHHQVVGDNAGRLKDALKLALERADIVVTTGGLGPTLDDITKETVAEFFSLPMVMDARSVEEIEAFFIQRGYKDQITDSNRKQALKPEGAIVLYNESGTAPGCIVERDGKIVIVLPGPPKELKDMFEKRVFPYLMALGGETIYSQYIRILGRGESKVEEDIRDLIETQTAVTIAPYAGSGEVTLRVTASAPDEESAKERMSPVLNEIKTRLNDYIYDISGDLHMNIEKAAAREMLNRNLRFSVAESLTGGMIAARLVSVPGISKALGESFVTYSDEAKHRLLGVNWPTLKRFGAVSRETAVEMAAGLRMRTGVDLALSITGIAGPSGGSKNKPVGLCYVALATPKDVIVKALRLGGDREHIIRQASNYALDMLRRRAVAVRRGDRP